LTKAATPRLPKHARDRDVVQDIDGRVFVTLGYVQPEDRILCFLKYIPDRDGDWHSGSTNYRRVFWGRVSSVVEGMSLVPSRYLIYDSHFHTELLELPRRDVALYFSPELRLREIIHEGPADGLEADAVHLAEIIHDTLGISFDHLGVTGSISWKAHDPERSDINMNVYGFKQAWNLQEGYDEIAEQNNGMCVGNLSIGRLKESTSAGNLPESVSNALQTLSSRRREFYLGGRGIGVMPVLLPSQSPIRHSDEEYTSLADNPVTVSMEIKESKYGIFMPAIYEGVSKPTDATQGNTVTRIMIYDGVFRGLLHPGDMVDVTGVLQRVEPTSRKAGRGEGFYQIMIGTKSGYGKEFIRARKLGA
jgi:hypothetical protein